MLTVEQDVRKQMMEELGESEPQIHQTYHKKARGNLIIDPKCPACRVSERRFMLSQKYGLVAPRLDTRIRRPLWMKGGAKWRKQLEQWQKTVRRVRQEMQGSQPQQKPVSPEKPQKNFARKNRFQSAR